MDSTRQRLLGALLLACLAGPAAAAELVAERLATIQRELRIGGDVLRAALDDALPRDVRLVAVEAGYLADQGVLVIADLARPWYRLDDEALDLDPAITSLEQIPDMVHQILSELNLGLSRHQVAELEELRGIRDAEQAVRAEQRALRAQLRELRRERLRADATRARELDAEISTLQARFEAAAAEERTLEREAEQVRVTFDEAAEPGDAPAGAATVDQAVAQAVCGYGATFRSISDDERLNVVLRRAESSRYFVFRMGEVRRCQQGDLDAEALLTGALRYGS